MNRLVMEQKVKLVHEDFDNDDDDDSDDDDIVMLRGTTFPSRLRRVGGVSNGQIQARAMQITREKV